MDWNPAEQRVCVPSLLLSTLPSRHLAAVYNWKSHLVFYPLFQSVLEIVEIKKNLLCNLYPPSIKPSDNASQWLDIGSMHFFFFLFILREIRVFLTDWPISRGRRKVGTADFFLHLVFFFFFLLSEEQWEIRGFLTDEWFFWGFLFRRNRWWFARPLSNSSPWNGVNLEKRGALFLDFSSFTLCFQVQFSRCLSSPGRWNESKPGEDATPASLSLS